MSDANPIAAVVLRACKYCPAMIPDVAGRRGPARSRCEACSRKGKRTKPRVRSNRYGRLTPEQRKTENRRITLLRKRRRGTDQAYRDKLAAAKRGYRERVAASEGRQLGQWKRTFEQEQDSLIERNARDAWRYWMEVRATKEWLDAYWSAAPWKRPGLSDAEQYRLRYQHDASFRESEKARATIRRYCNPEYAAQWASDGNGRWWRACRSNDGSITPDLIRSLMGETHCAYCHEPVDRQVRQIDHVKPLALGGTHSACNLVMACSSCNYEKSAARPLDWLLERCA